MIKGLLSSNISRLVFLANDKNEFLANVGIITNELNQRKNKKDISFHSGVCGLAWLLAFGFKKYNINTFDFKEIDSIIDSFIFENLKYEKFDFLHNALGGLLYFIERLDENKITKIIKLLNEKKKNYNGFVVWDDKFSESFVCKEQRICLSLSHGLSSFLALFNIAINENLLPNTFKSLLKDTVSLYKSIWNKDEKTLSYFPDFIIDKKTLFTERRLSWCWGDLGTLYQLLISSIILNDEKFKNEIIIHLKELTNLSLKEANLYDAGFCHGSTGVTYMFHKIYEITNIKVFKKASLNWLAINKEILSESKNKYYIHTKWVVNNSLLTGGLGTELMTKTMSKKISSTWDRCLLLS